MTSLLKIIKESGISFTGSIMGMALNYILLMVITRFVAPEEYGTFVLAQSIVNFSLIFVLFGTPKVLNRFIPFYDSAGEKGKAKTLIYGLLYITMLLGLIIGPILFAISGFLSHSLFQNPGLDPILKVMVPSVPMLAFIQLVSFTFVGYKELRYQVYIQHITLPTLKIVLGIAVFTAGYGLLGWTWIYVISLLFSSFLALWFFKRHISSALSEIAKLPVSFREIVSYSWPLSITSIILIFLGQIDFLFLGYYRPTEEIGTYRIYIYLVASLGLTLASFAQIYKPVISGLISKEGFNEIGNTYKKVSKWIFLINAFVLLVFLLFGTPIMSNFFGKSYLIAPSALSILAVGRFLNSSFGPEGMTLEAYGNTKLSLLNSMIMLGTNVGLDYLLIPEYGIIGAAIATASSITLGGLAGLIEIYLLYQLQPYTLQYLKYSAIVITTGGITYLATPDFVNIGVAELLVRILILLTIYTFGLHYSKSLDRIDYEIFGHIRTKITKVTGKK